MYVKKMIMKNLLVSLSLLVSSLIVSQAQAGAINVQGVTVARVSCGATGPACTAILGESVGPAACNSVAVGFDATTSSGKNALATLLTIKAAGFTANLTLDDTLCAGTNPRLIAVTAN